MGRTRISLATSRGALVAERRLYRVIGAAVLASAVFVSARGEDSASGSARHDRIVHAFDFDERAQGNLESLPRYWTPLRPPGFPRFTRGGFDVEVGRTAPPSFHLASNGRSVAYAYLGPECPVRTSSDYRVVAFVRPDRLVHARVCLSAFFVDMNGNPMLNSLVRSEYLGGTGEDSDWRRVELLLPASPPEARTIGLAAWVLQEPDWKLERRESRSVPRNDVAGGAWFDDITVYRLPRVIVASSSPGNVLSPGAEQYIEATLTDQDDSSLRGALSVRNVDGRVVASRDVPVVLGEPDDPTLLRVDHLPPGLYSARLDVWAGIDPILSRELTFARLSARLGSASNLAKRFGVSVLPGRRAALGQELELLRGLGVRSVKLPVWTGLPDRDPTGDELRAVDRHLQALSRDGFNITAVLAGAPGQIVLSRGAAAPDIVELLRGDPEQWRGDLSALAAPYSGVFHWWQLGPDGAEDAETGRGHLEALETLRAALSPYILNPRLVLPVALDEGATVAPGEGVCLQAGATFDADDIRAACDLTRDRSPDSISAHVAPLPSNRFERHHRLGDFAWRVAAARHAGATVFVPQPWRVRASPQGPIAEPEETFPVLRTLCDLVGDGAPGPRLDLGDGVEALVFHDGDESVWMLRDRSSGAAPRERRIQLGAAREVVDVEGVATPLVRAEDGRHMLQLSAQPVLVPGVERWLGELYAAPRIEPAVIEPGLDQSVFAFELADRGGKTVSGVVELNLPHGWSATPREFEFSMTPGRTERIEFALSLPHGEAAGRKVVAARFALPEFAYRVDVPIPVEVALPDISVRGLAWVEGEFVIVRHSVTNLTDTPLNFRASALAPGRERQNRPLPDLQPGDTQTATYRFARSSELIGRTLRVVLTEANDGPRRHTLDIVVP